MVVGLAIDSSRVELGNMRAARIPIQDRLIADDFCIELIGCWGDRHRPLNDRSAWPSRITDGADPTCHITG